MNKIFLVIIFIFFYNLLSAQSDSIICKWKWNQNDLADFENKYNDILIEPLIINNVIFFNGSLFPYNISTGKVLKYNNLESEKTIKGNCKDSVILFNEGAYVFIIDIYNGKVLYEIKRKMNLKYPFITKPKIVKNGICCFLKNDTSLVCYNYITKEEKWQYFISKKSKNMIYLETIEKNDTIILATKDKILFYNENGKELFNISINGKIHSNIILEGNILYYITSKDANLHAFNITNKTELWNYSDYVHEDGNYGGGGLNSSIEINKNIIYYVCGCISALDKRTGKIIWKNDSEININYRTQCIFTNKYIITRERQDDEFPILCVRKTDGKKINNSFGSAFVGESNVYSKYHKLYLNIERKEGISMKVNAWEIIND